MSSRLRSANIGVNVLKSASWFVASVLLFFTARRWLFLFAALTPQRREATVPADQPHVAILTPVRNEIETLPALLLALDRLDYPAGRLVILLLDDGSTDGSAGLMACWVAERPNWHLVTLPRNVGKARALNAGLAYLCAMAVKPAPETIVVVYDADERPQPDALRYLVAPFRDARVGAVSGRRAVSNPLDSPAASYTTCEGLLHQLITMRAKERLGLAPAVLGANCAYRRAALESVGAFKPGALLEDSDLSVKLPQAGWIIRFEPRAISYHAVPTTVSGYWQQHTRWARGFNEVARENGWRVLFNARLPLALRLELAAFALGYLDRLALALAAGLILLRKWSRFPVWVVIFSLVTPFVQMIAALKLAGASAAMWRRLGWLPFFFGLDMAMAASGFWATIRRAPQIWEERRGRL